MIVSLTLLGSEYAALSTKSNKAHLCIAYTANN